MKVNLENKTTGQFEQVKLGFSWTMLFFGVFVPIFRGDWKWALIGFMLALITIGGAWIALAFMYNTIYIKEKLATGFTPADDNSHLLLRGKGLVV